MITFVSGSSTHLSGTAYTGEVLAAKVGGLCETQEFQAAMTHSGSSENKILVLSIIIVILFII